MKFRIIFTAFIFAMLVLAGPSTILADRTVQDAKKPSDIITLGADAKLGAVKFSHLDHATKNQSPDGTKQIACVDCHHTAQPAADAAKHPPHKTVWPADRSTTLTAELAEKDPTALAAVCRDCHARAESKPKLLAAIPELKLDGSDELTILNNQQAFHRKCGNCHDETVKARPGLTPAPPTSKKCLVCHKKVAA